METFFTNEIFPEEVIFYRFKLIYAMFNSLLSKESWRALAKGKAPQRREYIGHNSQKSPLISLRHRIV
jgi:hypothetical protein